MPKIVDHAEYRKKLLTRCFDLFAQRGYSTLTMRQIAEALEVSTGTLYHYFPTKEALFQQLIEEVTQQIAFEGLARVQQLATVEERLTELFLFLAEHELDLQQQFLVTFNYYQHRNLYESDMDAVVQAGSDRYTQALRDAIGVHDPQFIFSLHCQIQGLLTMRMFHHQQASLIEQARPCIQMLASYAHDQIRSQTANLPEGH